MATIGKIPHVQPNTSIDEEFVYDWQGVIQQSNGTELDVPAYIGAYITITNCCIFLTGIIANVIIIVVVIRFRHMRTVFNFYLVNLSLADLCILLVCQPVAMSDYFNRDHWHFGPVICKLVSVVEHTALHSSLLTILVINYERRNAICSPLSVFKGRAKHRVKAIIPLIWLISIMLSLPFLAMSEEYDEVSFLDGTQGPACITTIDILWKEVFVAGNFLLLFLLPVIFMTYLLTKTVQTLRYSNNLRGLLATAGNNISRMSISSFLSPSADEMQRRSPYQTLKSLNSKLNHESSLPERDTIPNIIEEENEEIVLNFPDPVQEEDFQMQPTTKRNVRVRATSLIETNPSFPQNSAATDSLLLPSSLEENVLESDDQKHRHNGTDFLTCTRALEVAKKSPGSVIKRANTWKMKKSSSFNLTPTGRRTSEGHFFNQSTTSRFSLSSMRSSSDSMFSYGTPKLRCMVSKDGEQRSSLISSERRRTNSTTRCSIASSTITHRWQIKFLITIFIYFIVSYLPIRIFILVEVFGPSGFLSKHGFEVYFNLFWTVRLIMFLHSAANPLIFSFMSSKFSGAIKRLFFKEGGGT